MAVRLPDAATLDEFWRNLRDGIESVKRFTEAELLEAGESPALIVDPDYVRARPVLANIDQFDAPFFGMSPQDAAVMDPQHRVFLEVGYEALEHAGHDPSRFAGNIGVFATCGMNTYMMYHLVTNRRIMDTVGEWLVRHTGNDMNFLATRLSYQLGLKGPSMNVQTACSSALVAIHVAAQSLLNGECDMALAGGSVIALPQDRGYLYKKGEILSPDGHCRAFDAKAAGTLFGSGAGVVVLRRLSDAIDAGDHVLAVIRGSAVNNDGAMKVGYLAPSVEGQSRAVTEALAVSGVEAETISYIEAHGTATLVGDPIEITALTEAYRQHTDKRGFCAIGSLKSNIGHLGEAAGVAGFIKTVLSLQHRQLAPSLHYESPNPQIDFANSPFFVNATLREWTTPSDDIPRRAGITALGAGGTNCHVIVEEAPHGQIERSQPGARDTELIVLSAKTATALDAMSELLAIHLEAMPRDASQEPARGVAAQLESVARGGAPTPTQAQTPDVELSDAAYTLQVGRLVLAHRRAFVCSSREEAVQLLRAGTPHASATGEPKPHPAVFLFPGGGAQYPDMALGIYRTEPVFRDAVDRCLSLLRVRHGVDLRPMLFPSPERRGEAARQLENSTNSILSIFTIEYALAQLWMSWGVKPAAMTGHSVGEYAAACIAGVFSLEDALAIVHARGAIFDRLPAGAMLSIPLPEADVRDMLNRRGALGIAAVNAPSLCVVSGPAEDIATFERDLLARGIDARRLHISVAAHSSMLDPFLDEFRRRVASVRLSPPTIPFISNLSGRWIREDEATDPSYWVKHLRQTVRFSDGLAALLERPGHVWLEVGPGRTLSSLARQQPAQPAAVVTSLRHRDEEIADEVFLLRALGGLWAHGVGPDWTAFHAAARRRRVPLPTYPFERRRHWIPAGQPVGQAPLASTATATIADTPLETIPTRERDMSDWFSRPTWTSTAPPQPSRELEGDLLVFDDETHLGEAIAAACAADAASAAKPNVSTPRTWIVEAGESFQRLTPTRFAVRPDNAADYLAVFNALGESASQVRRVLHLWNVAATRSLDEQLARSFFSPMRIAQTIGKLELSQPIEMTFVTTGVQRVAGEASLDPVKATLQGPSRVIQRELPNVACRHIDVEPLSPPPVAATADWRLARLVQQLARELRSPIVETAIAYRDADRWVQHYVRTPLVASTLPASGAPVAPTAGEAPASDAYLITGGTGGLGLEIAEHLATAGKRRIVLLARTALPPRAEWDAWLQRHGDGDSSAAATAHRIRKVRACEALGAELLLLTADVTNASDMRRAIDEARAKFGRIGGVFHTAGALDDGLMQIKSDESAMSVLRPKVHGTLILDELLSDEPPDFLVLFSSISAVLGLQGQVDYAAANAFLDAFAHRPQSTRTRVISTNWCAWRDVGLAVSLAQTRQQTPRHRTAAGETTQTIHFDRATHWVIGEHVTRGGDALMPGTGYLELARAAIQPLADGRPIELSQVYFHTPFAVPADGGRDLNVTLRHIAASGTGAGAGAGVYEWRIHSADATHATGKAALADVRSAHITHIDLATVRDRCRVRHQHYAGGVLDQQFMSFGPRWSNITDVYFGEDEALAALTLPPAFAADVQTFRLHPALLDLATGGAQALIPGFDPARDFYVPFSYGRVSILDALPPKLWSHIRLAPGTGDDLATFDVTLLDEQGRIVVDITGFCMKRVTAQQLLRATTDPVSRPALEREPAPEPERRPLETSADLAEEMLRLGLLPTEGIEALDRILAGPAMPQVVISTVDLSTWQSLLARQARTEAARAAARESAATTTGAAGAAGLAGAAGATSGAAKDDIESRLAAIWSDILGVQQIAPNDNFFELGGHSLLAVRLLTRVERIFGRVVTMPELFRTPTIAGLIAILRETQPDSGSRPKEPALRAVSRDAFLVSRKKFTPDRS